MTVKAKIFGENDFTIQNKAAKKSDPNWFELEFQCLPHLGDRVIIQDGPAKGEYVVEQPIVHEIVNNKAYPLMLLKCEPLPNGIRSAIDN